MFQRSVRKDVPLHEMEYYAQPGMHKISSAFLVSAVSLLSDVKNLDN